MKDQLDALGAEIWTVAPDDPTKLGQLRESEGLDFPVLVDPDCGVIRAWGLLNEASGKVPHPRAVVVDREGVIRYLRVDEDYRVRPRAEELVEAVRDLP